MTIPLFPEGGLASSVITTVWVGVFVLCFFNLRFGWVLSGLVVPGYLVPLLIIKPLAAGIIVVEAVLTFLLVWVFSEKIGKGRWPALFGRDRFMGLILASIAVRLTLDGFALPVLADWLAENWNQELDWRSDLQSFGLVIVSLLANQFWKPGLTRGLFAMIVTVGLTLLIVRYGLMEFTNFRISGVSYLYEGLASSILASPKAYMILVLTAMYASHMNVKYGWDFSGILIPALIALQWYQPTKILTSFIEAGIIYLIAIAVLKLPIFANRTMEGGRKLLLFFNISFAYKLILGHLLVLFAVEVKTTDLYGFGYLLATLIAIKAHDKQIFPRLMRTTLQVSLVGAVAGNLFGLFLSTVLPVAGANLANARITETPSSVSAEKQLAASAIGNAYLQRWQGGAAPISRQSADTLTDLVRLLEAGLPPVEANARASASGWQVVTLPGNVIAIMRSDGLGGDLLLHYPSSRGAIAINAPRPASAPGTAMAAFALRVNQDARWLVLSAPIQPEAIGQPSVLAAFRSGSSLPELDIIAATNSNFAIAQPIVEVAGRSAADIDIQALRAAIPSLQVRFSPSDTTENTRGDGAVIRLPKADIARLASSLSPTSPQSAGRCTVSALAPGAQPIKDMADLAFLRGEVAEPVLSAISGEPIPETSRIAAQWLGLGLNDCIDDDGAPLWHLASDLRSAGHYFFAPGLATGRIVHGFADAQTEGDDASQFDRNAVRTARDFRRNWGAGIAMIAPTQQDYGGSQMTAFGVINQSAIRALGNRPGAIVQLRTPPSAADLKIAQGSAYVLSGRIQRSDTLADEVEAALRSGGYDVSRIARQQGTAGIEAPPENSLRYVSQSRNKRYAVVLIPAEQAP